jgi:hypothetical protein
LLFEDVCTDASNGSQSHRLHGDHVWKVTIATPTGRYLKDYTLLFSVES